MCSLAYPDVNVLVSCKFGRTCACTLFGNVA